LRTAATDAIWAAYQAVHPGSGEDYDVTSFGDSPEMADELASLVLHGPKRATAGLLRDFEAGGELLPVVGGHVVFLGGDGAPRGIWRTTEVRVGPLSSVDESFAWDEGEGDRTREGWLWMHRAFFARQAEREGFGMTDDEPTVFERFDLVWPEGGTGG
jgi:uncharacterized protein YhfF